MANIIIKPSGASSSSSWSNIGNAYDNSTTTSATVSIRSNNYTSRTATLNISIPTDVKNINSATITVSGKASSNNRVTLYVDINGSSSSRVISQGLTTTTADITADISGYVNSLTSIKLTCYTTSSSNTTITIYDVSVNVDYTESVPVPEPEPDPGEPSTSLLPGFENWSVDNASGCVVRTMMGDDLDITVNSGDGAPYVGNFTLKTGVEYTIKADLSNAGIVLYDSSWSEYLYITSEQIQAGYKFTPPIDYIIAAVYAEEIPKDIVITNIIITTAGQTITSPINVFLGSVSIKTIMLGSNVVEKMYVGQTLIFNASSTPVIINIVPPFSTWENELVDGVITGDYSMTSNGGGMYTGNLNMIAGVSYTIEVDAIGSDTYIYLFEPDWNDTTVIQLIPGNDFVNNKYTFTPSVTYGVLIINNWDLGSYSLSITNLRIYET